MENSMTDSRYHTKRWQQLRTRIIQRDGGRCAVPGCQTDMSQPRRIHVDHITEVRDDGNFWDETNLQTLTHHRSKTLDARKAPHRTHQPQRMKRDFFYRSLPVDSQSQSFSPRQISRPTQADDARG